jgi:dTDP-4-dehydrorhamnose 3,5-epimerase
MESLLLKVKEFSLPLHRDDRGYLLKAVMKEFTGSSSFGEIYFVHSAPGIVRANHFHKIATEWFVVVQGEGLLTLIDPEFSTNRQSIKMNADLPICVLIPPGVAHSIKATGTEPMLMMALSDRPYDPEATDTYAYKFD